MIYRDMSSRDREAYCKSLKIMVQMAEDQGLGDGDRPVINGPTLAEVKVNLAALRGGRYE